jgi:hypothetical protein
MLSQLVFEELAQYSEFKTMRIMIRHILGEAVSDLQFLCLREVFMKELIWPELNYEEWKDTCRTIHLWTQILGKIRLSKTPWTNHSWHSTLYVTECGLSTSVIHDKDSSFAMELDFLNHTLKVRRNDNRFSSLPLGSGTISTFYDKCIECLKDLNIETNICTRPNELPEAIPFPKDHHKRPYDPEYATRFWRALLSCDKVFKDFRSRFLGKVSPVHFFWGSFDLAVTRFSGRKAPEHPGGVPNLPDIIAREAYSHEVSSCGFWPGNEQSPMAAFYSYAYPMPKGFEDVEVVPGAYYEPKLSEFILPYQVVRESLHPYQLLIDFCQSTYDAAANLSKWDRELLEESPYLNALREKHRYPTKYNLRP